MDLSEGDPVEVVRKRQVKATGHVLRIVNANDDMTWGHKMKPDWNQHPRANEAHTEGSDHIASIDGFGEPLQRRFQKRETRVTLRRAVYSLT